MRLNESGPVASCVRVLLEKSSSLMRVYRFGPVRGPVVFYARDRDYAEEFAYVRGGSPSDVKAYSIDTRDMLRVRLPERKWGDPDYEKEYIARALRARVYRGVEFISPLGVMYALFATQQTVEESIGRAGVWITPAGKSAGVQSRFKHLDALVDLLDREDPARVRGVGVEAYALKRGYALVRIVPALGGRKDWLVSYAKGSLGRAAGRALLDVLGGSRLEHMLYVENGVLDVHSRRMYLEDAMRLIKRDMK